ncbi:lipopolysaccharide biosynthesis protein RfbH [Clostridiaceae bacterium UIB06]|uniref:Lipopolysaccharide biosynthesis protein RfbH n=1 Tax=Clostridium thailandense TaxID=2794346 RepID=A0A949TP30_9CLOT|nr:lipopolysaccharide biosynthesis protein RfbH [Clostridium thailandense]MBV7272802.1 lipopolysaccharide biosynthesis protein RfbH [Clostridium thailandense]MCH5137657.1 lipopolysaccharide biosynthesis protein RfbH [Clostridiaceae bacterium UIB06]
MKDESILRKEILERVKEVYNLRKEKEEFIPGKTRIHYSGRVFDEKEMMAVVDSVLDFWLTLGPKGKEFCDKLKEYLGIKNCLVVNSGSSANLVSIGALCSPNIDNPIKKGEEVITTAMAFPTTVAPIIQNSLIPVFVDIEEDTYNIDASKIENAISKKTRAIVLTHMLGNPAEMDKIMAIAKKYNLYVVEDTCDALDSKYDGKHCGTFGDISTFSFYPAHHITMGEGGAVCTNSTELYRNAVSLRDWGRACFCQTGEANPNGACGHRFDFKFEGFPEGYDHKYVHSNIGYNLKPLDIQCSMGIEQLEKLTEFTKRRRYNFKILYDCLKKYEDRLILPKSLPKSDPAWFAFPLTVRENAKFTKRDFVIYLENKLIETRSLFAGNILKHPGYKNIECKISGEMKYSDQVLHNTFFIGVYPGIDNEKLDYMVKCLKDFLSQY